MSECEAGRRNRQALHTLELDWGAGKFDYTKIREILTGRDTTPCGPCMVTDGLRLEHG